MATPHISAAKGDFAGTVLFPGDPLRAKFIATNFLQHARQVSCVRNMLAFTGLFKGQAVSVMGSGMGIPSCSIYAHELFSFYDVKNIIRIGSCGALAEDLQLGDIVVALGASTDSQVNRRRFNGFDFAATADFDLLHTLVTSARELATPVRVGRVFSSDLFYSDDSQKFTTVAQKMGILGVEMEAAGLYGLAASLGKKALAILSVSDHIIHRKELSSQEREQGFTTMIELALETVLRLPPA